MMKQLAGGLRLSTSHTRSPLFVSRLFSAGSIKDEDFTFKIPNFNKDAREMQNDNQAKQTDQSTSGSSSRVEKMREKQSQHK